MTIEEFPKSLTAEQAASFNSILVGQRDALNAARDVNEQTLASHYAEEISALTDQLGKAKSESESAQEALAAYQTKTEQYIAAAIAAKDDHAELQNIVAEIQKTESQKQAEALDAQIAELQEKRAALPA